MVDAVKANGLRVGSSGRGSSSTKSGDHMFVG